VQHTFQYNIHTIAFREKLEASTPKLNKIHCPIKEGEMYYWMLWRLAAQALGHIHYEHSSYGPVTKW